MSKLTVVASFVALMIVGTPPAATADWLLTPYLGGILLDIPDTGTRPVVGGSVSWAGPVAGFEVDFAIAPGFLESTSGQSIDKSNLLVLMGNALVQFPTSSSRVRPYGVGGIGLLQTNVTTLVDAPEIDEQNFGFNLGGGVMVFLNERVAVRGDFRYFRAVENEDVSAEVDALGISELKFLRAAIGVTFKF